MKGKTKKLVLSAVFLAVGAVLPLFTAQIKEIGDSLLLMHIPIMFCGVLCGARYGLTVGFILPFFRSVCFGMPPLFPNAVWMAMELATYGFVIGILYSVFKDKNILSLYFCLISSMVCGRIVWGISKLVLLSLNSKAFTFEMFLAGAFIDALPGIILQLILIPPVIKIIVSRKGVKQ